MRNILTEDTLLRITGGSGQILTVMEFPAALSWEGALTEGRIPRNARPQWMRKWGHLTRPLYMI